MEGSWRASELSEQPRATSLIAVNQKKLTTRMLSSDKLRLDRQLLRHRVRTCMMTRPWTSSTSILVEQWSKTCAQGEQSSFRYSRNLAILHDFPFSELPFHRRAGAHSQTPITQSKSKTSGNNLTRNPGCRQCCVKLPIEPQSRVLVCFETQK